MNANFITTIAQSSSHFMQNSGGFKELNIIEPPYRLSKINNKKTFFY